MQPSQMLRRSVLAVVALVCSLSLSARHGGAQVSADRAAPRPTRNAAYVVRVVANDFAFEFPATVPAGLTTLRLLNKGTQQHHLSIVRLDAGKTASDAIDALIKAGQGVRPAWMHPIGGPNATMPGGGEERATLLLEPGNYLAFCEVPGPDPMPHFMKGMAKAFTVTGPARTSALPVADVAITLTDFDFVLPRPLTRGRHVVAVTNRASQPHMLVMNRFPVGHPAATGAKEFLAWAFDPKGKPGPGTAVGGVTEIAPGATVLFERDFEAGRYLMICFTPDAKDGKPHFMHGMQREIVVQ